MARLDEASSAALSLDEESSMEQTYKPTMSS